MTAKTEDRMHELRAPLEARLAEIRAEVQAAEELERGGGYRTSALRRYGAPPRPAPRPAPGLSPRRAQPRPGRRPAPRRLFGYPWPEWGTALVGLDTTLVDRSPQYRRCMQDCLQATVTPPSAARQRVPDPKPGDSGPMSVPTQQTAPARLRRK